MRERNIDDLTAKDLGYAKLVEEVKIGRDEMTFVRGCKNPKAVSILVRGGAEHFVDEVERSLKDAIGGVSSAIEDGKVVAGGGAPEIAVAKGLGEYAEKVGGREQLAINAFADALEIIPRTLAESAGIDAIDALVDLRAKHRKSSTFGVGVFNRKSADMGGGGAWRNGATEDKNPSSKVCLRGCNGDSKD